MKSSLRSEGEASKKEKKNDTFAKQTADFVEIRRSGGLKPCWEQNPDVAMVSVLINP